MTQRSFSLAQPYLPEGAALLNGQFTIVKHLDSGGFGNTYKGVNSVRQHVAIKECYPSDLARRDATGQVTASDASRAPAFEKCLAHFKREAHAVAEFQHENIVRVQAVFPENGTAYMVMDFLEQGSLKDAINRGGLFPVYIQEVARQLLSALGAVHQRGMLHRDIKPANILLDGAGRPVLIDFGAARVQAKTESRMLDSLEVVSDGYSPPELYSPGAPQGPWSDLYSLAATLYTAITGIIPPNAQQRSYLRTSTGEDPYQRLSGRYPDFPPDFLDSIDRCMSLIEADRLQSAQEWRDQLTSRSQGSSRNFGQTRPSPEEAGRQEAAPAPAPPSRGRLLAAAVVGLALGAGATTVVGLATGGAEGGADRRVAALERELARSEDEVERLDDLLTQERDRGDRLQDRIDALEDDAPPPPPPPPQDVFLPRFGMSVSETGGSVVITSVDRDSPAFAAGLRRGDQIEQADGQDIATVGEFVAAADGRAARGEQSILLLVRREAGPQFILLRFPNG